MDIVQNLYSTRISHNTTGHVFDFFQSEDSIQHLRKAKTLCIHNGCVNTIQWNATGELLLSGSDDRHLVITNAFRASTATDSNEPSANVQECLSLPVHISQGDIIFSAKYLPYPYDEYVCSCTKKGAVLLHHIDDFLSPLQGALREPIFRHAQGVMDILTFPQQPQCFLSLGLDKKACWFDLRACEGESAEMQHEFSSSSSSSLASVGAASPQFFWTFFRAPLTAGAVHPQRGHELALATSDGIVRVLDLRKLTRVHDSQLDVVAFCHPLGMPFCTSVNGSSLGHDFRHITGLNYHEASGGRYMAVSHMYRGIFVYDTLTHEDKSDQEALWDTSMWDSPPVQFQNQWETTGPSPEPRHNQLAAHFSRFHNLMHNTLRRDFSADMDPQTKEELSHAKRYAQVAVVKGHRNGQTVLKDPVFWGEDFLLSGSECGHVFVWNWRQGKVIAALPADERVVNRVRPHPFLPMLATSGLAYDVKLWAPKWTDEEEWTPTNVETLISNNALHNFEGINIRLSELIRAFIALRRASAQNEGGARNADNN